MIVMLTPAEIEALLEAAEFTRKHRWSPRDAETLPHLNSAANKLRHTTKEE